MEDHSLGNVLRSARESAGKTVDDAVYYARMPRSVVEALEAGDFGFFTSPLYARSFLKQYGDYVGADINPWLNDFEPTTMIDGEALESFIDISEPVTTVVSQEKTRSSARAGASSWGPLWMFLITCGILAGSFVLFRSFEKKLSNPGDEDVSKVKVLAPLPEAVSQEEVPPEDTETMAEVVPEPPRRAIIVQEEP